MSDQMRKVTCIPAQEVAEKQKLFQIRSRKKRVAAYCRVSTEEEEQQSSFETQVSYYTQLIMNNPDWTLVGIFADEGISGTQTKKRTEFLKLMQLCEEGKVDLILVKSISRFARNTLDTLNYVRRLKEKNIAVIFEKENINTLDISSEMILTLYSSFAQAESESISKNITWAKRKEFKQGKVTMACSYILGYRGGENGEWQIVPEEARIVNLMDLAFLSGMSIGQIKKLLEQQGLKTSRGNDIWQTSTIKHILKSEIYMGDVLLQKTFTVDVLSHKRKRNEGELPQYYVQDHHPAIRSREIAYLIRAEFARRNALRCNDTTKGIKKGKYSSQYALTELLVCGECGTAYRRVTWAKRGKKKIVWRCINRLVNGIEYCKHSPSMEENNLQEAIVRAMNQYIEDRDDLRWLLKESINEAKKIIPIDNQEELDEKIRSLEQSVLDLSELLSMTSADESYFDKKLRELEEELLQLYNQKQGSHMIGNMQMNFENLDDELLDFIEQQESNMHRYNDMLVRKVIQRITVLQKDKIEVIFKDGKRMEVLVRV